MNFGEYFKNLRNKKNKTQKDIAMAIDKTTMLISGVESGKNNPFSEHDLLMISSYLELTDAEREELLIEAAVARGGLPMHIANYMHEYKKAYVLLNVLSRKKYDDKQIDMLIKELEDK